jgi:hypothetical protein
VTVLSARTPSARAPPGHDRDPDPAAPKADEPDGRAQPAPPHRTHPPAVEVDPGADQPTTPVAAAAEFASGRRQRRGSVTQGHRPRPPDQRSPRDQLADDPVASPDLPFPAVQPSTRRAHGVPSAATTTSRKSNSHCAAHRELPARRVNVSAAHARRRQKTTSAGPPTNRALLSHEGRRLRCGASDCRMGRSPSVRGTSRLTPGFVGDGGADGSPFPDSRQSSRASVSSAPVEACACQGSGGVSARLACRPLLRFVRSDAARHQRWSL